MPGGRRDPDLHVGDAALGAIRDALRAAGERVGGLAEGLPAAPDAGDAAAVVDAVLANLIGGASQLVDTAAGLWTRIEESCEAYRSGDDAAAAVFGGLGRLSIRGYRGMRPRCGALRSGCGPGSWPRSPAPRMTCIPRVRPARAAGTGRPGRAGTRSRAPVVRSAMSRRVRGMRSSDRDSGLAAPEGWAGFRHGDYRVVAVVLAALGAGACVLLAWPLRPSRVSVVIGGLAVVLLCGALVRFGLRYRAERSHDGRLTIAGTGEAAETVVSLATGHVATLRVIFGAASVCASSWPASSSCSPSTPGSTLRRSPSAASWPGGSPASRRSRCAVAAASRFPRPGVRVVGHERTRTLGWEEIGELVPHVRCQLQLPCRWLLLRERRDRFHPDHGIKPKPPARWSSTEWTGAGIEVRLPARTSTSPPCSCST